MRAAILSGLFVACAACGGPREGDPCAARDRDIFLGYDGVGLLSAREVYLLCSFPPGCDPAPEYGRWARHAVWMSRQGFDVCGCDGTTFVAVYDLYVPGPWRWIGSCEEPCAEVRYDPDEHELGYYNDVVGFRGPIAPQCTCADVDPSRCSVDSLGRAIPAACCDACIAESALDLDGVCRHPELEIPQACCAGCAEAEGSPSPDSCTAPLVGETSGSCCACGYAVFDAAGRCIDEAGERQVSRACCDCASTNVDPPASWCYDCANAERGADGSCVHAILGQPIDAACCACGSAELAADGSCVGRSFPRVRAPECCDCEDAQLGPDGGCMDSTSGLPIADFCCAP